MTIVAMILGTTIAHIIRSNTKSAFLELNSFISSPFFILNIHKYIARVNRKIK